MINFIQKIPKFKVSKKTIIILSSILCTLIIGLVSIFLIIDNIKLKVKLVDAFSGKAISNTSVKVHSTNLVNCIMAPCDTNDKYWEDNSDTDGYVYIPKKILQINTFISAKGYLYDKDLIKESVKATDSNWTVELDPDHKVGQNLQRFKLLDNSGESIKDSEVWILNNQNCIPPGCRDYSFYGKTNNIGNVYHPIDASKNPSWILVSGYKAKKFKQNFYTSLVEKLEKI